MLSVALPEARSGAVEVVGDIPPDAPALADADWPIAQPIRVRGRFSSAGEGKYYWKVQLETTVRAECRRCLETVEVPVQLSLGLIFSADDDAPEGEGCYRIPPRTQVVDLTDAVREEVFLAMPQFVECRPDCAGLCPRCGANLNDGPCGCAREADPRWDALRTAQRAEPPTD